MRNVALLIVVASLFCVGFFKTQAPGYEDLQFLLNGVNPVGSPAPPTLDTTDGLWSFSGTTDNVAVMWLQMPHGWRRNSQLEPHMHYINTAASVGTTRWRLEWRWAGPTLDFPAVFASQTITVPVAASTATHQLISLASFTPSNLNHSGILQCQLSRLANSDGADSYGNAVKLLAFDVHYVRDSNGSFALYGDSD